MNSKIFSKTLIKLYTFHTLKKEVVMDIKRFSLSLIFCVLAMAVFPLHAVAQQCDLLIIAPDEFVDELTSLKQFKDATGRPTLLVGLSYIYQNFSGADEPEQVKRCIAHYEQSYGVRYVLLAGDSDKFPVRYCKAYNTEWGNKYYPSDLYYMDLYDAHDSFDDWDGDGDGIIGEMDFKSGANVNLDTVHLYPDIAAARVPASTEEEITTYVNKVIDYEQLAPGDWFYNALLVVDGGAGAFGSSTKMDALAAESLSSFNVIKYYQNNAPYNTMTTTQRANEINTALNSGVGFVNYYGHGHCTDWTGWYNHSNIVSLTNDTILPVAFATACYTGRFHFSHSFHYEDRNGVEWNGSGAGIGTDHPEPNAVQPSKYDSYGNESLAEQFLVKNVNGAIGYIGCSSKGEHGVWLENDKGLSPYFFEEYDRGTRTLGEIWKNALTAFADDLQDPVTGGMHFYAFIHIHKMMLFGDPSLEVGGLNNPPVNDGCLDALPITDGIYLGTTIKATSDGETSCGNSSDSPDVWYSYTASSTGELHLDLCDADYDTVLSVHPAGCPIWDELACNDDCNGETCGGRGSCLIVPVETGHTYKIRVSGYNGASGNFTLNVSCMPPPPDNDECSKIYLLTKNMTYTGWTTKASNDGDASCGDSANSPDVWYNVLASCTGTLQVEVNSAVFEPVLSHHSDCPGSVSNELACSYDGGSQATLTLSVSAGNFYLFRVAGNNGGSGNFTISVNCTEPPPTPTECTLDDECDDGLFCNGAEYCVEGACRSSGNPCGSETVCDEKHNVCVDEPETCNFTIYPEETQVKSGESLAFMVKEFGECTHQDYEWSVESDIGSIIDPTGDYRAGINTDGLKDATDVVKVFDNTTGKMAVTIVKVSRQCFLLQLYGEGSEEAKALREFRDNVLRKVPAGREIIALYYELSPIITVTLENDEQLKQEVQKVVDGILLLIE